MKVVIVGAGQVGYNIADILSKEGNDVVVIDRNEEPLRGLAENLDVQTVTGSGSSPDVLKKAHLEQAEMLIAVTDSDETNMIACLLAATQLKVPLRVARIRNPELNGDHPLFSKSCLHIDLCINPEREAARRVMDVISHPGAAESFSFADDRVKLFGFTIDTGCPVAGKPLSALRSLYEKKNVLIASIVRGDAWITPAGTSTVEEGDYVFAITDADSVTDVLHFFGKRTTPPHRIVIVGGGSTGLMLAEMIERQGLAVKIIERREAKCEFLASRLEKATIIHGDGTSQDLLQEENIQNTDIFLAVTNDEEANILGALLAKQMGAKKVFSLINRIDYNPIVSRVGIDGVINPRHAAVGRILHFIRKGKIISVAPLRDEKAEAMELIALETSEITTRPLKDLRFPKGTIVGAIVHHDKIVIPDGNTTIAPGDRVIVFSPRDRIPDLQKLLTVKLEYF
jgi:trk system potassium uptake protein TrkA